MKLAFATYTEDEKVVSLNFPSLAKRLAFAIAAAVLVAAALLFVKARTEAAGGESAPDASLAESTPAPEPSPSPAPEPTAEPAAEQAAEQAEEAQAAAPGGFDDEEESEGQAQPSPEPEPPKAKPVVPENTVVDTSTQLYTYEEMAGDLQELASKYPDRLAVSVLAVTDDGRNVYLARLGNAKAGKEALVHAAIHAREYMTAMLAMSQLEYYLRNWDAEYKDGKTYGDIFNSVCLYMLPMVNPDGVTISQFGARGIKNDELRAKFLKMEGSDNYRRWKANVNGVNLNRNFNSYWAPDKDHPAMEGYCGPYAESEAETRAVVDLVNSRNFACSIAFHTAERTVYYNVGQKGEVLEKAKKLASLCADMTGYKREDEESVPRGLDYNWLNLEKGIPALIIECGISMSPLPLSEFPAIWKENRDIPAAVCRLVAQDSMFASAAAATEQPAPAGEAQASVEEPPEETEPEAAGAEPVTEESAEPEPEESAEAAETDGDSALPGGEAEGAAVPTPETASDGAAAETQ